MLKLTILLGLCLVAGSLAHQERARYDNYRVYKVIASSEPELAVLKGMDGNSDSIMFFDGIHFINRDINVVVAPHKVPDFLEVLENNQIDYILVEKDLQGMLDDAAAEEPVGKLTRDAGDYNWEQYYELDDTYAWMQSLVYKYPKQVSLIEGGKTYQGRSILGVKISYGANKPGIFLEAGIHAREWIAPATATYIINQLLTSTDPAIRNIAENYDWYVIPHANPDGYVYTHNGDRLWRKTRTPYGSCFGADANRNWAFHWNEVGASDNPCSDTYAGPAAFSEIETLSLSNYIASLGNKINLYLSFHAYSQYLLYPYGHSGELPPNVEDFKKVFDVATAAINKRFSTKYTGGNIYDAIYPAAGASVDWAYGVVGVKMSFCYEFRPTSTSILTGFRLPAAQIIPNGEEVLDSIVAMVGEVKNLGYFN